METWAGTFFLFKSRTTIIIIRKTMTMQEKGDIENEVGGNDNDNNDGGDDEEKGIKVGAPR